MLDPDTRKPVRVSTDKTAGPYITVSVKHLEQVRQLLSENRVSHWVDHYAVAIDGRPAVVVIHLDRGSNPHQVQALLDRAA